MKRKNLTNKKAVKVVSLGLAAVMASSPMTALAEELNATDNSDNTLDVTEDNSSETYSSAQEAVEEATDAVNTADDSVDTIKDDVTDTVKSNDVIDDTTGTDLSQAVIDAADDVDSTNLTDANTAISNTDTQLDIAKNNDALADKEAVSANNAADTANTAANEANDILDEANDKVDSQLDDIKDATSTEDANKAYNDLENTVSKAQSDFNEKLATYNDAKKAAEEAAAKAAEYENAYNQAIANADSNTEAAAAELEKAQAEAEALKKAVEDAKSEVDESAAGALAIKELEDAADTKKINWTAEDALFVEIMESYYLPEQMGIEDATVTRIQGKDNDEYNYFLVKYIDENGKEQETYYNYKLEGEKNEIVLFEKRDVEVNGDPCVNPDQYRDENNNIVSKDQLSTGLVDGTYVDVDGTYYEKNDKTGSETNVENTTITDTSTTDVTIDDSTKSETYKTDENGNLIKEVTADVTTATYTEKTYTSDQSYDTQAQRDQAAEAMKEALADEDKAATVINTENTVYTAFGTYIPTFIASLTINETVKVMDNPFNDNGEKTTAINNVKKDVEKDIEKKLDSGDEYYIMDDIAFSDMNANKKKDGFGIDTYNVVGEAIVTYAKITSREIDFSFWQGLGNIFTNSLEEISQRWVNENGGGIFVDANWVNWDTKTATIKYVAAVSTTGEEAASSAEANASLNSAIQKELASVGKTPYANATATATNKSVKTTSETTYSYSVDYMEKTSESTDNQVIETETYGNAEALSGEIVQNLNYLNGNIKMTQSDKDYRSYVDGNVQKVADYNRLLEEANVAQKDVETAQAKVTSLQNEIDALKSKGSNLNMAELEAALLTAEAELNSAEDKLEELLDKLDDAKTAHNDKIDDLTKDNSSNVSDGENFEDNSFEDDSSEDDSSEDDDEIIINTVAVTQPTVNAPVSTPVATTPVTPTPVEPTPVTEDQNLVTIEETPVPLASGAENATVEESKTDADQNLVTIDEQEVPLAAMPTEEEKATMSWWWLLIVAAMGATGYKLYRDHQKKKTSKVK